MFAYFVVTMTIMFNLNSEKEIKPSSQEALTCVRQVTKPSKHDEPNQGQEERLVCSKATPSPSSSERPDKAKE